MDLIKKTSWLLILVFVGIVPISTPALAVTISATIPGMTTAATTSTSPGEFVSGFYNFALMIGGVLAFGAIVYGGVLYAISGLGNPSGESEGKAWVQSALIGLLLLAGAYLVLYTINPNLVNLSLPTLQAINIQAPQSVGMGTSQGACNITCPQGSISRNMQTFEGGKADCVCVDNSSNIYCGGNTEGQCPNANGNPQYCVQISTSPLLYQCQSQKPSATSNQNCYPFCNTATSGGSIGPAQATPWWQFWK